MDDTVRGDANETARSVFAGLVPNTAELESTNRLSDAVSKGTKGLLATVPIVLVGSMAAFTLNLTGPISPANARPAVKPRGAVAELGKTLRDAMSSASVAIRSTSPSKTAIAIAASPTIYRVVAGDTVSEIAGRFGLSTASVLALNGLSWSSLIFPGQELRLTSHGPVVPIQSEIETAPIGRYTIVAGDTISAIADHFGVSTLSVLTANGLGWSSIIYPGQTLAIPGLLGLDGEQPTESSDDGTIDPVIRNDGAPADEEPSAATPVVPVVPDPAPVTPAPEQAPAPAPAPPVPTSGVSHTVQSGQTLSGIAALYAISTQQLLDANGLSWESIIYPGNVLAIPGGAVASVPSGDIAGLTAEMRANAAIIVQVGRDLGVPDYGIIIALATAMQESSLRNLDWGDRDSVGLFQQRPSSGWGSIEQLTTPGYAARLFYGGPSNPNVGRTRGLLDISGWQSMTLTRAAQAVQISGYPDAYAKWEASARLWFAELT